jgi:hypothetical protein
LRVKTPVNNSEDSISRLRVIPAIGVKRQREFPPSPFTRMPVYANLKADIVCGDVRLASEI